MLKDIIPARIVTEKTNMLFFDDGHGNGYAFPCDEKGVVDSNIPETARSSYEYCRQHPEQFKRTNAIVPVVSSYREEAHGTCSCGETVYLVNEYHGACECARCGRWYNLFGQELLPPEMWEDELEIEEW